MNALIIIGIIVFAFIIWVILGIKKDKQIYQNYALKNNWEYSKTDKNHIIYEILKTSIFYKLVGFNTKFIRKPYTVYNILKKDDEIFCMASVNGKASAMIPNYLIYHNSIELPKLFIISKKKSLLINFDINYYKDEFDEINADLSTDTHIVIINSYDKDVLLPKVKKIMQHISENSYLMIRNKKLVIYTFQKKIDFHEFINDCRKIKKEL